MSLSVEQVRHIALLARLALTSEEEETFAEQLGDILDAFAKLDGLDVSGVEPTSHVVDISDAYREDVVSNAPSTETFLANAPAIDGTYVRVPKIIE